MSPVIVCNTQTTILNHQASSCGITCDVMNTQSKAKVKHNSNPT